MLPSSRTPEGLPQRCSVCGNVVQIDPSMPPGDAPCPCCGCLLWFESAPAPSRPVVERSAPTLVAPPPLAVDTVAVLWSVCGMISALGIGVLDRSVLLGALWAAASLSFGVWGVSRLARLAERLIPSRRCLWRDVAFGWAFVPGPVAACLLGLLPPCLWGWPGSAFGWCLLSLALGPIFAVCEGLAITALVVVGIWTFTGKRFDLT